MELRHLRYFIAVAEQRNFSRAAAVLKTAQPSLSQQIRALEREIGVDLFDRSKRQITLTPAGVEFLADARALVARLDDAVLHAREAGRGARGELRIGYTVSAMMTALPAAIRAYRATHPGVRISLEAFAPAALLDGLRRRSSDVGVLLRRHDAVALDDIDVRRLGVVPLGIALPAGHWLAARRSVAIEAIAQTPLIVYGRQFTDLYDAVMLLCAQRGFVPAHVEEVERLESILGLVAAGEGVSVVPRVYETLHFPGVAYTALSPAPETFTHAIARMRGTNSPLTSQFVETYERFASAAVPLTPARRPARRRP
jgi:DNA-binding transcriptional LysR family regulator